MQHNYVDITGKRFGRLVAIKPTERKICNSSYWICKCDCGNYTEVLKSALMRKKNPTISCGCAKYDTGYKHIKHFGCMYCGSDKHYAKGYCRSCYNKLRRGTLE